VPGKLNKVSSIIFVFVVVISLVIRGRRTHKMVLFEKNTPGQAIIRH
jgi:hypothetical protein